MFFCLVFGVSSLLLAIIGLVINIKTVPLNAAVQELHKESMMSMICKGYNEIKSTGKIKLFKSHKKEYQDGCQERDFVYVKDCVDIMWWLLNYNISLKTYSGLNDVSTSWAHCIMPPSILTTSVNPCSVINNVARALRTPDRHKIA